MPSWHGSCERYALSLVAAGCRWSLLLLSPLLSAHLGTVVGMLARAARALLFSSCCPTARWRLGPEVTNRPAADVFKSAAPEGFWQKRIRSWARAPRRGPAGTRC